MGKARRLLLDRYGCCVECPYWNHIRHIYFFNVIGLLWMTIVNYFFVLFVWIILKSLFSTYLLYIGTDRSLPMGHDAPLLWQMARDLLHALAHRHDNTWMALGEPVVGTGRGKWITWWYNATFLKQTDLAGLKSGWPTWQTETLTIMLFPLPTHCQLEVWAILFKMNPPPPPQSLAPGLI